MILCYSILCRHSPCTRINIFQIYNIRRWTSNSRRLSATKAVQFAINVVQKLIAHTGWSSSSSALIWVSSKLTPSGGSTQSAACRSIYSSLSVPVILSSCSSVVSSGEYLGVFFSSTGTLSMSATALGTQIYDLQPSWPSGGEGGWLYHKWTNC